MSNESKYVAKADLQAKCMISIMKGFWNVQDAEYCASEYWKCHSNNFANKPFKLLCDMKEFKPAGADVQKILTEIQQESMKKNLTACAIIVDSALTQSQMRRLNKEGHASYSVDYFVDYNEGFNWLKTK